MDQPKFLFVFGTRPESIKLAPLILEAKKRLIDFKVCFTGQHMEMALPILNFFKIEPDYNLSIMKHGQTLNDISQALFEKFTPIVKEYKPTCIIVQGDTTTASIASLIGFYEGIQIVHIEAGLRTYNMRSPWPEEFNRRLIALATNWHFAPTERSMNVLLNEGILKESIFIVGNTGIDALRIVTESGVINKNLKREPNSFHIIVTLHRRENFGDEMVSIMDALRTVLENNLNIEVTWPLHQNPQVKNAFQKVFKKIPCRLHITEPLGYFDFISIMKNSDLIVTDSGGIQEEAPFLAKPILICRHNTERPESVDCGAAKLVGTSKERIIYEILNLSQKKADYQEMAKKRTPFGDGFSSQRVFDILLSIFCNDPIKAKQLNYLRSF